MIPLPRVTLRDDHGRPVPLWRSRGDAEPADSVPEDLRRRISAAILDQHRGIRNQAPLFLAIIVVVALSVFLSAVGFWSRYWSSVAIPVVTLGFMFLRMWMVRQRLTDALRATLLAEGHCASCGYNLRGLAPVPDGFTICPECAAAWRLNPALAATTARREAPHPAEIGQDRAARRQLHSALQGFGVRRRFAAVDASGRIVDVICPDPFAGRPARWAALDPPVRRRLRRRFRTLGLSARIAVGLTLFPFVLFQAWQWLRSPIPSPLTDPLGLFSRVFGTLILPLIYGLFVFRPYVRRAEVLVNLMLEEGCCPSCAEPVADEPVDEHGNIICPHCRATWDACKALRAIRASQPPSSGLARS